MKIINWWIEMISLLLAGIGIVGYFRVSNFYAPIFAQFIGVGIAVFLITLSIKSLANRNEKKRLILQMSSPNKELAHEALRQINFRGWLEDGSLVGEYLGSANLENGNLYGANLNEAFLQDAILINVNLIDTNMEGVSLDDANLERAYLSRANLSGARLVEANLENATLNKANLERADLWGANLTGADLTAANLKGAGLHTANLKGAKVKPDQLAEAASLEDATMPDGVIYNPEKFNEWLEEQETQ